MLRPHTLLALAALSVVTILAPGCGGKTAPNAPALTGLDSHTPLAWPITIADDVLQAPIGRFHLTVNSNGHGELTPARLAQAPIGMLFNVDLTEALTESFCRDCLSITGISKINGGVRVGLEVRHPFAIADDGLPPSAANRRDLWMSTVKGILLLDSSQSWFDGAVRLDAGRLMNADGYTSVFDLPIGLNANTFPYRVFGAAGANAGNGNFDGTAGWSLNYNDPEGYAVLANDQTRSANYDLRLAPGESVTFDVVLTAAYCVSASNRNERLIPSHFMPAGAPPEPWRVLVTPGGALEPGNPMSSTTLLFQALDWQQDPVLNVDPTFPNPLNRRGLAAASRIAEVSFSLPGLTGEPVTVVDISGATGAGTSTDPWSVSAPLFNSTSADEGLFVGVAKFLDERDPQGGDPPFGTTTFIQRDLVTPYDTVSEFATYAAFTVTVGATTGCVPFTEIWNSDADLYTSSEVLFEVVGDQTALLDLLAQLESRPVPLPPIDWATQQVLVASSGFAPFGLGERYIELLEICPSPALGWQFNLRRGDPLSCPGGPRPSSPYIIALFDRLNPEYLMAFEQVDTCTTGCDPVPLNWLDSSDAFLLNGYTGPIVEGVARNSTELMALAGPLYGNNPMPPVDFGAGPVIVVCSGFAPNDDGQRYASVLDVCVDTGINEARVTWELGEFLTCDPPPGGPSAPFSLVQMTPFTGVVSFDSLFTDVCKEPPPCDDPLQVTLLIEADVTSAADRPATAARITSIAQFAPLWGAYFPNIPMPIVNFTQSDVYLLALEQNTGSGGYRLQVNGVCRDTAGGTVTVNYTRYEPLSPFCPPIEAYPTCPVVVFMAPAAGATTTILFEETLGDSCMTPMCAQPLDPPLSTGNAAADWTTPHPAIAVVRSQGMYNRVWQGLKGPEGGTPPPVNFNTHIVVLATTGFHEDGAEVYGIKLDNACDEGAAATVQVRDIVPVTCPPPLPVATTPYILQAVPRGSGFEPSAYAFSFRQLDACEPGANCEPEFPEVLDTGDYPDNTKTDPFRGTASSDSEYTTLWNSFFTNPGTRPPAPAVDFQTHDVLLHSTGFTSAGAGERLLGTFQLCVDPLEEFLRITYFQGEHLTCEPTGDPTHPWEVLLIPKGAAGWTLDFDPFLFDMCFPEGECYDFEEIGRRTTSSYTSTDPLYLLLADKDFDQRKQDYQDAWALIGTGEPPGLRDLQEDEAVVVLIYGQRNSHLGLHSIALSDYCVNSFGLLEITVERSTPLSGCNGLPTVTSPYAIYKAPLVSDLGVFNEVEIDSCP